MHLTVGKKTSKVTFNRGYTDFFRFLSVFLDFQAKLEIFKAIFRGVLSYFVYGCFICEKNLLR
jgi:hypothetical protein